MLLNLVAVANTEDKTLLWGFISRYAAGASPASAPYLDQLVGHAIAYYRDHIKPTKRYRAPTPAEASALQALRSSLAALPATASAEEIQTIVYQIGKDHGYAELRQWFLALYEVLLGQSTGPRMGGFFALYGLANSIQLLEQALAGQLAQAA